MFGKIALVMTLSAEVGARTSLYCATEPSLSAPQYSGNRQSNYVMSLRTRHLVFCTSNRIILCHDKQFVELFAVYICLDKNFAGKYFDNCQIGLSSPYARNEEMAQKLWELSTKLVKMD